MIVQSVEYGVGISRISPVRSQHRYSVILFLPELSILFSSSRYVFLSNSIIIYNFLSCTKMESFLVFSTGVMGYDSFREPQSSIAPSGSYCYNFSFLKTLRYA